MASTSTIKTAIKSRIDNSKGSTYSAWTIGITGDLETRKKAHDNPKYFKSWEADSLTVAQAVETYFINDFPAKESERMKGGTGGDIDGRKTIHVYIY